MGWIIRNLPWIGAVALPIVLGLFQTIQQASHAGGLSNLKRTDFNYGISFCYWTIGLIAASVFAWLIAYYDARLAIEQGVSQGGEVIPMVPLVEDLPPASTMIYALGLFGATFGTMYLIRWMNDQTEQSTQNPKPWKFILLANICGSLLLGGSAQVLIELTVS